MSFSRATQYHLYNVFPNNIKNSRIRLHVKCSLINSVAYTHTEVPSRQLDKTTRILSMSVDADPQWVPVKLTYVEYPKGDLLGKFLAFLSLSPMGVVCAFMTLILFRRDLHTITFFIGLLINDALSKVLKQIIAEHRPLTRTNDILYNEYGMPSSHAQFMFCFSSYMFFFMFFRINYMKTDFITYLGKSLIVIGLTFWSVLVCISRVYLQYHSVEQVTCGAIIGTIFASVWFLLTQHVFTHYYAVIASWRISEMFLIRDTTLIPNILWFEYTSVRQEVRSRRRKSDSRKSQ